MASSPVTREALPGVVSQPPSRAEIRAARSFSPTTLGARKFSPTKPERLAPSWSFLRGMSAVCGILMPSG